MSKLLEIQKALKAPKNQFNSFGKYKYRNCEDILEALKLLLTTRMRLRSRHGKRQIKLRRGRNKPLTPCRVG